MTDGNGDRDGDGEKESYDGNNCGSDPGSQKPAGTILYQRWPFWVGIWGLVREGGTTHEEDSHSVSQRMITGPSATVAI